MLNKTVIGVDIGGTKMGMGKVVNDHLVDKMTVDISSQAHEMKILEEIAEGIQELFDHDVDGIGIGVPSLVDVEEGIVYDVQNIPSWKKVYLKRYLIDHFNVPVYINNDANCFALGEKYFGQGKSYKNMVGLTIGTGLGAGIIINDYLYCGMNCGAGEFGSIPYNSHTFEYYCSGHFFFNEYHERGHVFYDRAKNGDKTALKIFEEFGTHLGNAIITILFAVDPETIILGGSISESFDFFRDAMWRQIRSFPYQSTVERLVIGTTAHTLIAPILGAAALYYNAQGLDLRHVEKSMIIQ